MTVSLLANSAVVSSPSVLEESYLVRIELNPLMRMLHVLFLDLSWTSTAQPWIWRILMLRQIWYRRLNKWQNNSGQWAVYFFNLEPISLANLVLKVGKWQHYMVTSVGYKLKHRSSFREYR